MRAVAALLVALVVSGVAFAAEQDGELKAAQVELKLAQDYLQAAGRAYGSAAAGLPGTTIPTPTGTRPSSM